VGGNVRTVQAGDRVLFDPSDRSEVEVRGDDYVLLRERDLHAVASERLEDGQTGLYL
jgi:chaperonin GroES